MKATFLFSFATVLTSIQIALCQDDQDALIDTGDDQLGKIQGSHAWAMKEKGVVGRKYYFFTGIPYANPESYTNENRFKPSEVWDGRLPDDNGTGIFFADLRRGGIVCPQKGVIDISSSGDGSKVNNETGDGLSQNGALYSDPFTLLRAYNSRTGVKRSKMDISVSNLWGREECLILTVNTPKIPRGDSKDLLPVIFFIHGGGFDQFWGNLFGGQRLLNSDVVLVSMNYRLGALGSLNLGIDDAPGNAAVYDCITALKWIQKYIHHFGGDKGKVTVSGQSAGAVLATTLFLSPLTKGLLHGAIGDSGSALSVWASEKNPIQESLKVVGFTSCKTKLPEDGKLPTDEEAQEIRDCMKNLDLVELINARGRFGADENLAGRLGYSAFVPSVQKASLTIPLALPATPAEILKRKEQNNVPLMMGATRHDGSFVMISTYYDYLVANGLDSNVAFIKNEFLHVFLKGVGIEDQTGALLHSLQKAYLGDTANMDEPLSKLPGVLDLHTVIGFKAGGYGLVEAHAKLNPNSYYYAFDYQGAYTTYDIGFGVSLVKGGIAHIDDLLYLFQLIPLQTADDWAVSDRYVGYWVNFATHGNPNGPGDLDTPFPKYNSIDHRFLIINQTDQAGINCRDTWFDNSVELNWIQ